MKLTTEDIIDALMLKYPTQTHEVATVIAKALNDWITEQNAEFMIKVGKDMLNQTKPFFNDNPKLVEDM